MVKEGYTPRFFRPIGGTGKTSPRNVPALAPNCLRFYPDELGRHPPPMPITHDVCLFCGHGIGANGTAAKEGAT